MAEKWISIGPYGAAKGQAAGGPPVGGRISDLSIAASDGRIYAATPGGVWRSDDEGKSWFPLMDDIQHAVAWDASVTLDRADDSVGLSSIAIGSVAVAPANPQRVYAGTGEFVGIRRGRRGVGIWMTENGGRSWILENASVAADTLVGASIYRVIVHPSDPNFAYAATSRGLYRRTGDAATGDWTRERLHPNQAANDDGITEHVTDVMVLRDGADIIYVAIQRGGQNFIRRHSDANWTELASFSGAQVPFAGDICRIAFAPTETDQLYCITSSGILYALYRSEAPGTRSWRQVTGTPAINNGNFSPSEGGSHLAIAVHPTNPNRVLIGGARSRTTDGVDTYWSAAVYSLDVRRSGNDRSATYIALGHGVPPYVSSLRYAPAPSGNLVYLAGEGGFYSTHRADAAGQVFQPRNTGLGCFDMSRLALHPTQEAVAWAGTRGQGVLRYLGNGIWSTAFRSDRDYDDFCSQFLGDCDGLVVHRRDPFQLIVNEQFRVDPSWGDQGGYHYIRDGGANPLASSYSERTLPGPNDFQPAHAPIAVFEQPANDADAGIVALGGHQLTIGTDFADDASMGVHGPVHSEPITALHFAANNQLFAATAHGQVFSYQRAAAPPHNWAATPLHSAAGFPATTKPIFAILTDPAAPTHVYIGFGGADVAQRVWYYDGTNWSARSGAGADALPNTAVHALRVHPGNDQELYAATDHGVYKSTDAGATWSALRDGLPSIPIVDISIHHDSTTPLTLLRASTRGRGVYELHLSPPPRATTPDVELFIRDHYLDVGLRTQYALPQDDPSDENDNPADRREVALGKSPDFRIDSPDSELKYQLDGRYCLSNIEYWAQLEDESERVAIDEEFLESHIYVQVHSRGLGCAQHVQLTLLLAAKSGDFAEDLPEGYHEKIQKGQRIEDANWKWLGQVSLDRVQSGRPAVGYFPLPNETLNQFAPIAADQEYVLLAFVHHIDDPFSSDERNIEQLIVSDRKVALHHIKTAQVAPLPPRGVQSVPQQRAGWVPIGPSAVRRGQAGTRPVMSGRVTSIAPSRTGDIVYIGTASGGVWRTSDGGATWESRMTGFDLNPLHQGNSDGQSSLSIGAVAIHPDNPDRVFCGTGERSVAAAYLGVGVFVSEDAGQTWVAEEVVGTLLTGAGFFELAVDPRNPQRVVAATQRGLLRREPLRPGSPQYVWRLKSPPGVFAPESTVFSSVVAAGNGGQSRFFATTDEGQTFVSDDGDTWVAIAGYPANRDRVSLAVQEGNPDLVYAYHADRRVVGDSDEGRARIYRAERSGATWGSWVQIQNVTSNLPGGQRNYNHAIAVCPDDRNMLIVGGCCRWSSNEWSAALYRLEIQGNRVQNNVFIGNSVHPDVHFARFVPGQPTHCWVGCDGGAFRTTRFKDNNNLGTLFDPRNAGLQTLLINHLGNSSEDPNVLYCGTQDNGGLQYTGEEVWRLVTFGDGGYAVAGRPANAALAAAQAYRLRLTYVNRQVNTVDHGGEWTGADGSVNIPARNNDAQLFYSPFIPAPSAAQPERVAFGTRALWVSDNFARAWRSIPANGNADVRDGVYRSLASHQGTRIYGGTTAGTVRVAVQAADGSWTLNTISDADSIPGAPRFNEQPSSVTGIAIDPASPADSIYVSCGGRRDFRRVWHYNGTEWSPRSGEGADALINTHMNCILTDATAGHHSDIYVGGDAGVWLSKDAGLTWRPLSLRLPDAPVMDLQWSSHNQRRIRVATYGRGVFELDVDAEWTSSVELYVRSSQLDAGREGVAPDFTRFDPLRRQAGSHLIASFGTSPDIKIHGPDASGQYQTPVNTSIDYTLFVDQLRDDSANVAVSDQSFANRVYVQVHNRGPVAAMDVEVVLLLCDHPAPQLPANYVTVLRNHGTIQGGGWSTVGRRRIRVIQSGVPQIARIDLQTTDLPRPAAITGAGPHQRGLLVLVHQWHDADPDRRWDPFLGTTRDVPTLCRDHRQAAYKIITLRTFTGTAPAAAAPYNPAPPPQAPAYVPPDRFIRPTTPPPIEQLPVFSELRPPVYHRGLAAFAVALRARAQLQSLREDIADARTNYPVAITSTTEYIDALAEVALQNFEGELQLPVPDGDIASGLSKFLWLGVRGFDLIEHADILSVDPGWASAAMLRDAANGTDSRVRVGSGAFVKAFVQYVGEAAATGMEAAQLQKLRAFATGLLCAYAEHIALAPYLRNRALERGQLDWSFQTPGFDDVALSTWISRELLGGSPEEASAREWWPNPDELPQAFFETYIQCLTGAYDTQRWAQEAQSAGLEHSLADADEIEEGYRLFYRSLTPSMHWALWWLVVSPVLLLPAAAPLVCLAMPQGKFLFREADPGEEEIGESKWYQLVGTSLAMGSVMPLAYSMALWPIVPRQDSIFIQSLVAGIARVALAGAMFGTLNASPAARWGAIFSLSAAIDVYFAIRAIIAAADGRRGTAFLFGLQALPLVTTIPNLLLAVITDKGNLKQPWQFGLLWALLTGGLWIGGGMAIGAAIARNGGLIGLLKNRNLDARPEIAGLTPTSHLELGSSWAGIFHALALQDAGTEQARYPEQDALAEQLSRAGSKSVACGSDEPVALTPRTGRDSMDKTALDEAGRFAALLAMGAAPGTRPPGAIVPEGSSAPASIAHRVFRQWNLETRHMDEWKRLFGGGVLHSESGPGAAPDMAPTPNSYASPAPEGAELAEQLGWIPTMRAWQSNLKSNAKQPVINCGARASRQELDNAMRFLLDLPASS